MATYRRMLKDQSGNNIIPAGTCTPTNNGETVLLQTIKYSNLATSGASPTIVDILTLFANPGSTNREQYFDKIIIKLNLALGSGNGYFRIGNDSTPNETTTRCMINIENGVLSGVQTNNPNIIFGASSVCCETISVVPVNMGQSSHSVDDISIVSISTAGGATPFGVVRLNFGSLLRLSRTSGKMPIWLDGATMVGGDVKIYGVKYGAAA